MNKILFWASILAIAALGSYAMLKTSQYAINKHEKNECLTWADQAHEYATFYLTQWQADQCKHHGIVVDAPIKQLDRMYAK